MIFNLETPVGWWQRSLIVSLALFSAGTQAAPVSVKVTPPPPAITSGFKMGTSRNPAGDTLTLDSRSLLLNGRPWMPVMGEFHFARYPSNEWREELLKMKAGGVDIVSTYVFWIHHEEIEGQFDWTGSRDLRQFIQTCQQCGLYAVVRCGPWDHGEVRNGGFPDWLLAKGWKTRSNDTNYLEKTKIFYGEIARQLNGLFWKDGGPVVGIQFENEYNGPAEHLLTLKRIGQSVGLNAPLYTRTGWNQPRGRMPFGELIPLYGVYAEGFWDRTLTSMPNGYWKGFQFSTFRMDDATYTAIPGKGGFVDPSDAASYPYLTCEIGGGMMNSYHRRILVDPRDSESTTLIKLGSGGALLGYYMYHGGVNPEGKLTTLMESQATGYWNDMPVKNYDFQAPLGQYGQIRPQYHLLRRLHLFLHEWGSSLAGMPAFMPDDHPFSKEDVATLRWSVRSDGKGGFVFVNNYERGRELPPKKDVQFNISLSSGSVLFPSQPITVPSGVSFILPFNLDLGHGISLAWATAQPLTALDDGNTRYVFFRAIPGVPPVFAFPEDGVEPEAAQGKPKREGGNRIANNVTPGTGAALTWHTHDGHVVQLVVLDDAQSLQLWKGNVKGRDRVFLTDDGLEYDGDRIRLTRQGNTALNFAGFPLPAIMATDMRKATGKADGVFARYDSAGGSGVDSESVVFEQIQKAGPPREIPMGKIDKPMAAAPLDDDFAKAAVWRIKLPGNINLSEDPILRFHYVGDVARVMLNGKLITDDFYNGNAFEIGLRRHAPEIMNGDLEIEILPLRKDAPIYMAPSAKPDFGDSDSVVELKKVELEQRPSEEFIIPN